MDIAEIRKKAKAQKPPDGSQRDSARKSAVEQTHVSHEEQTQASHKEQTQGKATEVAEEKSLTLLEKDVIANQKASDGLDRLFSAIEDCAFSFTDGSEQQGEIQSQSSRQYLTFNLSDEEYALDITQINEIIKVREFTAVPRVPAYILGIISLRGVVVPVFDLRQRLNLGKSELMPSSRVVVCHFHDITAGLLVDSINQVVDLVIEELEPPPGVLAGLGRELIDAIGRCQGRMIILLNLQRVMDVGLS